MGRAAMVFALFALACGARESASTGTVTVEPSTFLLAVGGASSSVLRPPERSIDELEVARREARGADRRTISRELVIAHVFAAEHAEGREARRIRRRAEQLADATVRGSRDDALQADMAFAKLWMSWRAGAANAEQRAERFTDRYRQSGDLLMLAWMIRGEIALERERYDDALAAFRFALGQLEHPLYAYALFRSARVYREQGQDGEAVQALTEVEALGCARGASPSIVELACAAATARGAAVVRGEDGAPRPASCAEEEDEEEEGWRPAE